jgi:DNA-binding NarL/FixJ family response regulator
MFLVVASSDSLFATVHRTLSPYRRTRRVRDEDEALAWVERESAPIGVVVESELGASSGIDALAKLRERISLVPAVLLADSPSREALDRGYELRATHLSLPLEEDALLPFVFRALTEEIIADERVGCLIESLVRSRLLTPREAELLVLVIGDVPRKVILERMAISDNTLKGHVRQVLRKLEAPDLDKLAARVFRVALQNGGGVVRARDSTQ